MALQTVRGRIHAESADDLTKWLSSLAGCPPVSVTHRLSCDEPVHDEEHPDWFYVEADALGGVARRRCLACGGITPMLDSEQHWTHPPAWACRECGNCIVEVAVGLSVDDKEAASWLALAVRCVDCGLVEGVTDLLLPGLPASSVLATL
ncbi:MAG: hypothetical protein ACYCO3_05695 [Mycobacteriales bacterium]